MSNYRVIDDKIIEIPSFVDLHVHLREPGFTEKETIKTGTNAAARGGYSIVCSMPNLKPAPDTFENLSVQLEAIKNSAIIDVLPYGCITMGQKGTGTLSAMEEMAPYVAGFSDDGRGVADEGLMEEAMLEAKRLSRPIVAHCEDMTLITPGGCINKCAFAEKNGLIGISSESEWKQIERDLKLADKTKVVYHVCHISTKESVELIRDAKKSGVNVSCETAPHYLVLCDEDLQNDGRFKMNPPLRGAKDRQALIEGIIDGTIDVIATDHAPHTFEEKDKGLANSLMGIVGLECAFPVLYTNLVKKDVITLEHLVNIMSVNPRNLLYRFTGREEFLFNEKTIENSVVKINISDEFILNSSEFASKGRCTPFNGMSVFGRVIENKHNGKIIYKRMAGGLL